MGACMASEDPLQMQFLGLNDDGSVKTCEEAGYLCGQYELSLATGPTRDPVGEAGEECFGFTESPLPVTPPTPGPPAPTPSSCDLCLQKNLQCCGTGDHAFCYDPKSDQCCEAPFYTKEFPVVTVCALGQQCHPGCFPSSGSTPTAASVAPSLETFHEGSETCPGKLPSQNHTCTGVNHCCGAGTVVAGCCLKEQCCHPEGTTNTVCCATGQRCASTSDGLAYCIPMDNCDFCYKEYPGRRYLCQAKGSDTCQQAPDATSCYDYFRARGKAAVFCPGDLSSEFQHPSPDDISFELI